MEFNYSRWEMMDSTFYLFIFFLAHLCSAVFLLGLVNSLKSGLCPNCLQEMHWQLHLIDSFIIALLMMTFPILSVQLFSPLWFQLLIIPHQSALIWWGSKQSYCFPHSQLLLSALPQPGDREGLTQLNAEQRILSGEEESTNILTYQQGAVTDRGQYKPTWVKALTQRFFSGTNCARYQTL